VRRRATLAGSEERVRADGSTVTDGTRRGGAPVAALVGGGPHGGLAREGP